MTSPAARLAPRLYQLATEALARDIRNGTLGAGQPLTQLGIAARFGISRAPARKALDELADQGLLLRSGSGRFLVAEGQITEPPQAPSPDSDPADDHLTQRPSWELLYPEIEMAIVSRTSLASWRVNESNLARHYGVSRTVARDVIGRLQQRGIIRKDEAGRWFAPALTEANFDELYELRRLLEPVAMEKAFPRLPEGYLAAQRAELLAAMAPDAVHDAELLDRLEMRLHVELLSHCGNGALMRAISLPQAVLVAHHFLYSWTLEFFGTEPFLPEHLEVLDRLIASDVEGAKAALVAHLEISRRRAVTRIEAVKKMVPPDLLPYLEPVETEDQRVT